MMMITGVFKHGKIIRRKTKAKKNMQFLLSLMYFLKTSFFKKNILFEANQVVV